jgi:hypothetical protein
MKSKSEITVRDESLRSITSPSKIDPEPIAIITLCVGTLAMAGAVANTFINYKKYLRDESDGEQESEIDFMNKTDALRAAGERLLHVIMLVSQNGETAFALTGRVSPTLLRDEAAPGMQSLTLRSGETSIDLDLDEREKWNSLVSQTAKGVELMNSAIQEYEDALSAILASGRRLDTLAGLGLESLIGNVVDHGIKFRKALDSYQTLRASSTVEQAQQRFTQLVYAAEAMVEAANGFAKLCRMFLELKRGNA